MATFLYNALTREGELVRGELRAADACAAIARLHDQALLPIDATEATAARPRLRFAWRKTRPLPGRDLALVSQQLARLLKAGLPLDRALDMLVQLSEQRRTRESLQDVLSLVRDGSGLADALAAQGKTFPEALVTLVRAGELSGALQGVLAETATFLTRSEETRQKVVSAMVYPIILIVVASFSIGVILTAVLPQFEPMFREAGAKLPISTRVVVAAGDGLRTYWWLLLLGAIAVVFACRAIDRSPAARTVRDRLLLRLPLVQALVVRFEVGRFCRTLGVMLASGVAASTALGLASGTIGNSVLAQGAAHAAVRFREGEGLSIPLARSGYFPATAIQLIRIGEETGRLDDMLHEVADLFDQEVQRLSERLLAALVPALTVGMGLLVALIVGAVITALMSVNALAI